jgi:predicted ATP-dependent serine protease
MTLTGRIKGSMISSKLKEAERLGFDRAVIPASAKGQIPKNMKMAVKTIDSITELPKLV